MSLFNSRSSEPRPSTRTDTPAHVDSAGRTWTGADYDEARANGRPVQAPRTTHSTDQLGRTSS
ncbi:hypothetical protein [Kitasatospora cheerisanensis]|uniref:Uncharacterized protein n=1 Tax=Kitasatospora cheerisanensis KCTC 2395 TaxID=1348663 RepID=A0A066YQR2_9ACTN|nr:hypothetical protein [Kitasatospora cheerisanensis]KDN80431.1 hypothetical protein KCH_78050 [Kitasatospora cheerisanensis KCTC 2395]